MTHQPHVSAGNDAPCLLEAASLLHGSVTAGTGGGGDGGGDSSSSCGRCGGGFSLFFNKRVACGGGCGLAVCRRCAPWSSTAKAYVCCVCSSAVKPATLATPTPAAASVSAGAGVTSSRTSLQPPGSCSEEQQKEVEAGVRSHIEALVEGQVGGPLDSVSATPNTTHPLPAPEDLSKISEQAKWELLLHYYCYCHDRPLPPEDLPTTRHTHLTDHVTQVLRDAMILPRQMEGYDPAVSPETPVEDFNSHTYEDILATAILNKVLESCDGKRPSEVTIEVSHDVASTDTDSGMSGGAKESHRRRHKSEAGSEGSEERSLTPPARQTLTHRPPTASPDQGVVTDDCWGPAHAALDAPLQFKIEEHVEEVTTHHVTDDDDDDEAEGDVSDSGGSWRGSRGSLEERRRTRRHKKVTQHSVTQDPLVSCLPVALPDPAQVTSRRVSFPELGRDIIQDSCSDSECCAVSPGDMVVDADSWEENWLFRRHRLAGSHTSDPVTMLIPNPEAHVTPTVGNRDVDELSELSEQQSVGSSEPWSDSDGEGEGLYPSPHAVASRELSMLAGEIVAEFGQQDREYTVDYSSASRMSARRTPPPHSPSLGTPSRLHTLPQHTAHPSEHYNGKPARGSSRDSESVSDSDRPIPKPRKLSLATTPSSKASDKSPPKTLTSPVEDLTILSPPLEVPLPSEAKSSSETVWFVETPQDCIVPQGRTLRLSCALNTKRPMGITWYHNGSLVRAGRQEVWVWRRGPTHHLHLYNMTPDAAGVYAAAAYTASHCVWAFCRVHYKASARPGKRPTFTKGLTDATVEEGGELSLQCQVQGHPEPRVTFSHGIRQLEPSSRLAIESDQYGTWTLRLTECVLADAGEVTATANNTLAATTCRCQVKVLPEGTPLPRQDATRLSRPQSNQQLKGKPDSKPTHRTLPTGSHPPDNTSCTLSTNALTTSARLTHEEPLTKSSGVHSGDGEQEDIQQVPTKPGTIAEREHRKWEAAVPLPNNPYSPERLAHRLSHTRPPDHPLQTRHAPPVEFPRGDEVDLDPSLQDGMSSREDLRRYSRDYYVGSSTSKTAPRGRNSNLNYPKHPQNQSPGSNQHQLTNGHHSLRSTSQQVIRNGQEIRIAVGSHSTTSHRGENLKDSRGKPETGTESPEVIESCRAGDWKDELKDIQAARVEQEVARLQRTIEETQRRWETYARHAPGRGTSVLSDGSIEHLHHPRPEAYLVPPRHDLWRTVSEDTISVPLKEAPSKHPLLRHISMDNLRPATKVSNIHPFAHHPHQSTTSINSVGSSLDGPGHPSSYSPAAHLGRSVESVGEYSDRDALDSDGSLHTPEESLALPSVRKLASRFDSGPQKVNNLDKHGTSNSLTYSGKNIQSGGRNTQGDRAAFTNNLNKSTEKPYIMKEVHSLTARSMPLRIREGLRAGPASFPLQGHSSPARDAPSPEHLGIPWGPAAIPTRPTQVPGDTSDDSSAPPGSPRRVPRRRSGGKREHPGWCAHPEALTDPAVKVATDSYC